MKLQVALDLVDLRKAIALTRDLCEVGLEIVEAGTPLIKMYGLPVVGALKAACPRAEVVADLKTADVGALEASLAREFGADWATVLGATNMKGVDVVIAASRPGPGVIKKEWVASMNKDAIVFALANPVPEIWP